MGRKKFTVKKSEKPPIVFDMEFETPDGTETETFTCLGVLPASVLADFTRTTINDERAGLVAMVDMVAAVLVDEDVERFTGIIHSKDKVVSIDLLSEIVEYIVGEYSERPTQPPSASPDGRKVRAVS